MVIRENKLLQKTFRLVNYRNIIRSVWTFVMFGAKIDNWFCLSFCYGWFGYWIFGWPIFSSVCKKKPSRQQFQKSLAEFFGNRWVLTIDHKRNEQQLRDEMRSVEQNRTETETVKVLTKWMDEWMQGYVPLTDQSA